jgi:tRNA pseudouridine55 synthase
LPERKPRGRDVRGLLLLDKPRGLTSNQALQRAKRLFQAAKAGHCGSLDPLATGMLPLTFGAATKIGAYLLSARKSYNVVAELGVGTSTGDAEGAVTVRDRALKLPEASVAAALAKLTGDLEQVPPMFSALKQGGVPLYRLARRGVEVPREPRRITVHSIKLESYEWPEVRFSVCCSKGTYVRTLVTDLAASLGTVGHVRELRRIGVDPYGEEQLRTFEELERCANDGGFAALDRLLLPAETALSDWPQIVLSDERAERLMHGQTIAVDPASAPGLARVYAPPMRFIAIGEVTAGGQLVPRRVFLP